MTGGAELIWTSAVDHENEDVGAAFAGFARFLKRSSGFRVLLRNADWPAIISVEAMMIRNSRKLRKFYRELMEQERFSYKEAVTLYESLHREAVALKAISSENILEGLEVDLRIARAVNGLGS